MTIYNLGSINIDHVYRLDHLPHAGETLAAETYTIGLGGKGANQSVAAARALARVIHVGAMSDGDEWVLRTLVDAGVDTGAIERKNATATGHAIILVDDDGENSIILHPGANRAVSQVKLDSILSSIGPRDFLLMQNETSQQAYAAQMAHKAGATVIYSAAPFEIAALRAVLPFVSILALNEGEHRDLEKAFGTDLPVRGLLITRGSDGAEYRDLTTGTVHSHPAFAVIATDTTGAGDCFAGWFAAGLDRGEDIPTALRHASAAAALQVTRQGAGDAMPGRGEVMQFLAERGMP